MSDSRDLDIVLFGATGFTGGLTAEYLAHHAPANLRWALAGRSPGKLEGVRTNLRGIDPRLEAMELLHADVADTASLDAVASRSRVVVTTVGPYLKYGEPLVAACAANGTDYVDLSGEPEFVDQMYLLHHATAEATGSRLVHACGFDAVPHDLGAMFAIEQLKPTGPVTMRGVVRASATPSGGTFHSLLGQFSRVRQSQQAFRDRIKAQPKMVERSSRAVTGRPHHDPDVGVWLLPMPLIDAQIVARSGAALASYGPEFRYSHYAGIKSLPVATFGAASVAGLFSAAQVPPLRRGLLKLVPQGAGPDEARRDKSWFKVDFIAESDGRKVHTRVSGGDPGYTESSKMLAESALCLAYDENPKVAGQVTTAEAMGEHLTARLISAGLKFERLS